MKPDDLTRRFGYHRPDDVARIAHEQVRADCLALAQSIDLAGADSREKSLAITALEETMMWANAMIAREGADRREADATSGVTPSG